MNNLCTGDAKVFSFERFRPISLISVDETSEEQILLQQEQAKKYACLSSEERFSIVHQEYRLTGVPLAHLEGKYPPAGLFTLRITLTDIGLVEIPSKSEFVQQMQDGVTFLTDTMNSLPKPHSASGLDELALKMMSPDKYRQF